MTLDFKDHMTNLDTFRQAVESPKKKKEIKWATFVKKLHSFTLNILYRFIQHYFQLTYGLENDMRNMANFHEST